MSIDSVILVNQAPNAQGLQRYLARRSADLTDLRVITKEDVLTDSEICSHIRYIFGTWNMPEFSEAQVTSLFPSLEAIFYAAGDTAYYDKPFKKRGVKVFAAELENSIPVAEFVVAQVLLANKGYFQALQAYHRGFWRFGFNRARSISRQKPGNFGASVGIIGCGTIGSLVAERLRPFNVSPAVYDPLVPDEKIEKAGASRADLREIFETCDVITNHLPDTAETRGMLDYRLFAAMKPNATFINTGRGWQVDERGLAKAMRECPTRSALLDVTRREPPDPHSPLYRVRNIFLSPHIAGSQGNELERLYEAAYRQFEQYQSLRAPA